MKELSTIMVSMGIFHNILLLLILMQLIPIIIVIIFSILCISLHLNTKKKFLNNIMNTCLVLYDFNIQ